MNNIEISFFKQLLKNKKLEKIKYFILKARKDFFEFQKNSQQEIYQPNVFHFLFNDEHILKNITEVLSVVENNKSLVKLLQEVDKNNNTPVHILCKNFPKNDLNALSIGHLYYDLIKTLASLNIKLITTNNDNMTPIDYLMYDLKIAQSPTISMVLKNTLFSQVLDDILNRKILQKSPNASADELKVFAHHYAGRVISFGVDLAKQDAEQAERYQKAFKYVVEYEMLELQKTVNTVDSSSRIQKAVKVL